CIAFLQITRYLCPGIVPTTPRHTTPLYGQYSLTTRIIVYQTLPYWGTARKTDGFPPLILTGRKIFETRLWAVRGSGACGWQTGASAMRRNRAAEPAGPTGYFCGGQLRLRWLPSPASAGNSWCSGVASGAQV